MKTFGLFSFIIRIRIYDINLWFDLFWISFIHQSILWFWTFHIFGKIHLLFYRWYMLFLILLDSFSDFLGKSLVKSNRFICFRCIFVSFNRWLLEFSKSNPWFRRKYLLKCIMELLFLLGDFFKWLHQELLSCQYISILWFNTVSKFKFKLFRKLFQISKFLLQIRNPFILL